MCRCPKSTGRWERDTAFSLVDASRDLPRSHVLKLWVSLQKQVAQHRSGFSNPLVRGEYGVDRRAKLKLCRGSPIASSHYAANLHRRCVPTCGHVRIWLGCPTLLNTLRQSLPTSAVVCTPTRNIHVATQCRGQ